MIELNLRKGIQKTKEAIGKKLEKLAIELSNEIKKEAPVDRGRLRQSFQVYTERQNQVYGVRSNLDYALPVHEGTRPFYPPIEPLKGWARRVLGSEDLAYAVQSKIAEEGIDPNPFVERAIQNLRERYV